MLTEFINKRKLGTKLVIIFAGVIIAVLGSALINVFILTDNAFDRIYKDKLASIQEKAGFFYSQEVGRLGGYSKIIAEDASISGLVASGDTKALETVMVNAFKKLNSQDSSVHTLEVTDAGCVVLMRGHNPKKSGDNKSKTLLFGEAMKTQSFLSGAEVSTSTGLLSLDAVSPIFQSGKFVGLLKVGSYPKSENLIKQKKMLDVDVSIVMEDKEKGISSEIMKKYEVDSKFYEEQKLIVYGSTFPHDTAALFKKLPEGTIADIDINGQKYITQEIHLNIDGKDVHEFAMIAALSKTELESVQNSLVKSAMLAGIVALVAIFITAFVVVPSITSPIRKIAEAIRYIEKEGDLKKRVDVTSKDEVGIMADNFNSFIAKLQGIITDISGSASSLSSASEVLSSSSDRIDKAAGDMADKSNTVAASAEQSTSNINTIASAAGQMSSSISSVAAAIEELNSSLNEVAQNCQKESRIASSAKEQAVAANETMKKLDTSATSIDRIIDVIKGISEQTNLLALNATIEAARAGEAGIGFAVVANEVKELAKQTAQATQEIQNQIAQMQENTVSSVKAIEIISDVIEEVNSIAHTIVNSVDQQSSTVREISSSVSYASQSASEVAVNVDESAKGLAEVAATIAGVNANISDTSEGIKKIRDNAGSLKKLASGLVSIVRQFKI
ncbi:MAG: HAMP domain-containing protein [Desulfamplus sp.]|nr:HAMP domain-containing protein [Desulfamplus sp.]